MTIALPSWLSDEIKNAVRKQFLDKNDIEIKLNKYRDRLNAQELLEFRKRLEEHKRTIDERWEFIRIIFESSDLKSIWEKLANYSDADISMFIREIFALPHNWEKKLARIEKLNEQEKNIVKSINKLIKSKKDFDRYTKDFDTVSFYESAELEDAWKIVESSLRSTLFEIDKKSDSNYADYYFSLLKSPITRKNHVENAHAIYCMRYLALVNRRIFDQPLNDVIANFVNTIFEAEFSYDEVAGYTKDTKEISKKFNDINIPFASTVDPQLRK